MLPGLCSYILLPGPFSSLFIEWKLAFFNPFCPLQTAWTFCNENGILWLPSINLPKSFQRSSGTKQTTPPHPTPRKPPWPPLLAPFSALMMSSTQGPFFQFSAYNPLVLTTGPALTVLVSWLQDQGHDLMGEKGEVYRLTESASISGCHLWHLTQSLLLTSHWPELYYMNTNQGSWER